MFRRKGTSETAPARRPHPDPKVEAELQRIISLQNAVRRKEDLLDQNQADIAKLRANVRDHPGSDYVHRRHEHIARLQGEMAGLEQEVTELHDQIAKRMEALSDTEASYLNAMDG